MDNPATRTDKVPLCVDLDGTLLRSDSLYELLCQRMARSPLSLIKVPLWLLGGKARFKRHMSDGFGFDVAHLPFNEEVLKYLSDQRQQGRHLVLATAADRQIAEAIASHLGIFDEVIASDGVENISGGKKLNQLRARFGERAFDYIGNSKVDLPIWGAAREALIVSADRSLLAAAGKGKNVARVFAAPVRDFRITNHALRTYQWVKNLLLFAPLVMAHKFFELERFLGTVFGFIAFSLCASSVYLLNDLFDLPSDRQHPHKRNRPFASGILPLQFGLAMIPLLMASGLAIGWSLSSDFVGILGIYLLTTLGYSAYFKQVAVLDIILLAMLYALRILAGGYAAQVPVSQWMLAFSMFFFLSLACIKRYAELLRLRKTDQSLARGRGYRASDLEQIAQFGSASGYISALVLALYISSREVVMLYPHPQILWFTCPLMLYWISRIWLLAHRGELHEDPIVFAIGDRASYLVGILSLIIMLFASV